MDHTALFADAASRPVEAARHVLDGLSPDALHTLPDGRGNSIAWLVWHAARQQDVQVAALRGGPEVWESGGWAGRVGVDRGAGDFGFGDGVDQVQALRIADADALLAYLAAVADDLTAYTASITAAELDDVVDTAWTPHVTRGVRLVSVIDDAVAHLGQAAYVRGLVEGWSVGY
ncbi:MAG: DUF664 domain-containing protein [Propionibacteriaceae bacterium]|nr:DUF664 domain-containing protein [Propionibacteriaceae bacterium]